LKLSKPKIAILTQWYLPGNNAGGPVKSLYSLIEVLKSSFDFYVITTNQDLNSCRTYSEITPNIWINKDQVNYLYHSVDSKLNSNIILCIIKLQPDLLYLNSFWSWPFSLNILRNKARFNCNILLAPRGMLSNGALKIKPLKKQLFIVISKLLNWHSNIYFQASSYIEKQEIEAKYNSKNVLVLPNFNSGTASFGDRKKPKNELNLFYLSRIAKVKNLHLAINYLQKVSSSYKINYNIYGNIEDQKYWGTILEAINKLPKHVRVQYKGKLNFNQVQDALFQEDCLLLPTMNENFGHSIVESLLSGCTVIISNNTPWLNLQESQVGFNLDENNENEMINAIEFYAAMSDGEFLALRKKCNLYISEKLNLASTIKNYITNFNECIQNRPK